MDSITDRFGTLADPDLVGRAWVDSDITGAAPAIATVSKTSPATGLKGLLNPRGSAIFWVVVAAVLGLAMVSGQLKVSAALNGRGGKR